MCTVSFIAKQRGYLLGMNRDEKLTRERGVAPKILKSQGRRIICPSERGGGTWIALNESGTTLALINWYSVVERVRANALSRGEIVRAGSHADKPSDVEAALQKLPLRRINPFRLIGVFPLSHTVMEWRWNLRELTRVEHKWETQQWISSGYDEPTAQRIRSRSFRTAQNQKTAGTLAWLRSRHRSHTPSCGPFSTCMHRADAATVSYTEVVVTGRSAVMRYQPAAPCRHVARVAYSFCPFV